MDKEINWPLPKDEVEGRIAVAEAAIHSLELSGEWRNDKPYWRSLKKARDYWKNYLKTYYN